MKLTRKQLSKIIREEYLRSTPATPPGQMMTEARARMLAEQVMDEGLFDMLKAVAAGVGAGADVVKKAAGQAAGAAAKKVQAAVAPVIDAGKAAAGAIKSLADETQKAAATAMAQQLFKTLKAEIDKALPAMIKKFVAGGASEENAKADAAAAMAAAISAATGQTLTVAGG